MQDIIKQWPVLSLFPMCTTDAGLSIRELKRTLQAKGKAIAKLGTKIDQVKEFCINTIPTESK